MHCFTVEGGIAPDFQPFQALPYVDLGPVSCTSSTAVLLPINQCNLSAEVSVGICAAHISGVSIMF